MPKNTPHKTLRTRSKYISNSERQHIGRSSLRFGSTLYMTLIFVAVILSAVSGLLLLQISRSSSAATGGLQYGIVTGSDTNRGVNTAASLGIGLARFYEIGRADNPTLLDNQVLNAVRKGVEPVILIDDDDMGRTTDAGNAGAVAARFGKGGTFWQAGQPGAGYEQYAPRWIEWGNETSYSYGNKPGGSAGGTYGRSALAAAQAMKTANPNIGLLVQGEDGDSLTTTWIDTMFAATPTLHTLVAGWTVHPYGPQTGKMDRMVANLAAKGVTSAPIFITEDGISTDNGRTLSNNYGWPTNLTYDQASSTLNQKINLIKSKPYANRIRAYMQFQANDQRATGASTNREHYFGILRSDDSTKGNYTNAVVSLAAQHPRDAIPPITAPAPAPPPAPTPTPTPSPPPTPTPTPKPGATTTTPPNTTGNSPSSNLSTGGSAVNNEPVPIANSGAVQQADGTVVGDFNNDGIQEIAKDTNADGKIDPLSEIVSRETPQAEKAFLGGMIKADSKNVSIVTPFVGEVKVPKIAATTSFGLTGLVSAGFAGYLLQRKFGLMSAIFSRFRP